MGQTFTTLSNAGGYEVTSVTLRNRSNAVTDNGATWTVRLGGVAGSVFSPIATETSNNVISYLAGDFITFTFDTPVQLAANTVYGFDWTTNGQGFVTDNNTDGNYAGGTNYATGDDQIPDDNNLMFPGDDRVFHVNLTAVPEPGTLILLGIGMGACLFRRRMRRG